MENYIAPTIEVCELLATDLITKSVTLDENELSEDRVVTA